MRMRCGFESIDLRDNCFTTCCGNEGERPFEDGEMRRRQSLAATELGARSALEDVEGE
jgi:hypothetical protein